ncbi:MAG: NAD(+) synthase [Defluviitaleaceae bacterium]|nr:NAD(+) synthase [Defluviitaleaceae bacterium]MCL2203808.1 NAD(+) synthase [Defluviitaleaceae bacterium]MCL2239277.1 NAD(+) synthase [Defluviitaleaceae bacterium]
MRDYKAETKARVDFIRNVLASASAGGIVYGNSGGKDSALVGILCKMACDNTLGLIMPCGSQRNYESDKADAQVMAAQFNIAVRTVDLSGVRGALVHAIEGETALTGNALANIAPRLRMTALYAVGAAENRLVAGTGNRSEIHMGYFTKYGDGACDFNPIADLTVTEIYEFLAYLGAPGCVMEKAPSAGLYEGQTDEGEMGISYRAIDGFLLNGTAGESQLEIINQFHNRNKHKRVMPIVYGGTK